ncbi:MAG: ABC transporter permease subunit [Clostridia bacterium]|nr:ABC transporter permease subunit [Clostridia bacterium]
MAKKKDENLNLEEQKLEQEVSDVQPVQEEQPQAVLDEQANVTEEISPETVAESSDVQAPVLNDANKQADGKTKAKQFFKKLGHVCKIVGGWIVRMIWGASKIAANDFIKAEKKFEEAQKAAEEEKALEEQQALADAETPQEDGKKNKKRKKAKLTDVEEIVSPGKQYVKAFFEKKLAVTALVIVIAMFLFVFIGPLCMPTYTDLYKASSQAYLPPTVSMLSLPKELDGHIKSISSSSFFTVGLSDTGNIYIWGVTKIGTTKIDIEKSIPQAVKDAKIEYVAAGTDHIVAIGDDGTVYAWGHKELGQYIENETDIANQETNHNIIMMPEDLRMGGKIDVANVKKLVCGNQITAILMKDGTVRVWGNTNTYRNASKFANKGDKFYDIDVTRTSMYGVTYDQKLLVNYEANAIKLKYKMNDVASADQDLVLTNSTILSLACANSNLAILVQEASGKNRVLFSGDFGEGLTDIPALGLTRYFTQISAGAEHYLGVSNDGYVYAWGDNIHGQLKISEKGDGKVSTVYAEAYQSYAVSSDNKLVEKSGLKGYIFGTDANGASVFKRLVNGGRMTLTIGAVAVIISSIIGIIIGVISGYFGGKVDMFLMRVTEVVGAIPFLPFAMILSAIMSKLPIGEDMRIFIIMVILGVLSWTGLARLVRGQVLATRECEYITAAKAMGVSELRIAFKHILPNVISVIIVTLTLDFAGCMLTESGLSYLGFGVTFPRPTWGNMLNATRNLTIIGNYWWLWLFPSIFLAITTICINIIGDALRDVMDPRTNKR